MMPRHDSCRYRKSGQKTLSGLAPLMNAVGYADASIGATGEEEPRVGREHLLHGVNP